MFGKTRDNDTAFDSTLDTSALEGIFGDEEAAADAAEMSALRSRVEQAEAQISSQFTSLATYAQIAQEQVELARSEARAQTERSEQRVTSLIERERADRISGLTGAPVGTAPDIAARLDALESSVAVLRRGLDDCRQQQKALAMAITTMFERVAPVTPTSAPIQSNTATAAAKQPEVDAEVEAECFAPPSPADAAMSIHRQALKATGPIPGLALNG